MRKVLFLLAVIIAILSCNAFAMSFSDLESNHWAFKPISSMTAKGILVGYPDGSFKPNQSITRAEFAKILVNALSLTGDSSNNIQFRDVTKEHWAYDYVSIASKYLTGYQNNTEYLYMPDSAAVREDMALAMVTAMGLNDYEYKLDTLNKFSDKADISNNLKKYVAIAAENGLMNGNADGTFNPKGHLTRAEVCQLMSNALDKLEKIAMNEELEVVLSANKKDGTVLNDTDTIKLTASNYANKGGTLDYRIYYNNKLLRPNSFNDGDSIKVKEIIEYAKLQNIDLYGEEIVLELFFDNLKNNKVEGKVSYTYTIRSNKVELSANKKNGAQLRESDSIKLSAKNYNSSIGTLDYRIYFNNKLLRPSGFKDGDSIKVKEIIEYAKSQNIDLYGKEIVLELFLDNLKENKTEGKVTYTYFIEPNKIETRTISIKEALVEAQFEGKTLDVETDNDAYSEFFVIYNRPLKEAKVEAKDQNGLNVKLVDARVATEFEDDITKRDIRSVRIRIVFDSPNKYTFTVKDVIDKEGNKIEDYSFDVYTKVPVKDVFVEVKPEENTENTSENKIDELDKLGIITKYADGEFKSENIPTNYEAVNYVIRLLNYQKEAKANNGKYEKLDSNHWANGCFYVASEKGFFANLDENKFISNNSNITCEEFVILVLNAMGYAPITLNGANNYWMNAKENGLFNDMQIASIKRNSTITRGFVADILYNALNAPMIEKKSSGNSITYEKTTKSLYEIRF